jgi:imidazolonepropionase-like amidohydrolase
MRVAISAITNVYVFDGTQRDDRLVTVTAADGVIRAVGATMGEHEPGVEVVDGQGGTLLPGLIDAHIHLGGEESLCELTDYGVTTGLDMGTWPPEAVAALRNVPQLTDIRSPSTSACGPDGAHAKMPGFPPERIIRSVDEARRFVDARIAEGVDYIKVITEAPGEIDRESLSALVGAAQENGLLVIAHAVALGPVAMAQAASVDVIAHTPLDGQLGEAAIEQMLQAGSVVVPTLIMMQGVASSYPGYSYDNASANVAALHAAGVTLLAGTDANNAPGAPVSVPHGESIHREFELLVQAGLTPVEALTAATVQPAAVFGLADRGAIRPGLRADLLLVAGDPTRDISATRDIRGVWISGAKVR